MRRLPRQLVRRWPLPLFALVLTALGLRVGRLVRTTELAIIPAPDSAARRPPLSTAQRRAIFVAATADFPRHWDRARSRFPDSWSIEDDFHYQERLDVGRVARDRHLRRAEVYLILDEGIRNRWPSANGRPLNGATPPLSPRVR